MAIRYARSLNSNAATASRNPERFPGRPPLVDSFGRVQDCLRISVTDRCNLRCTYCMPPEGIPQCSHDEILSFDEITQVARVASNMGVHKLRITGGEPLVRRDVAKLVGQLTDLPHVDSVHMTTNGVLLDRCASALRAAGLNSLNISLDSLHPERFAQITHRDNFDAVWRGIHAALDAGFPSVKINVVVIRGFNDDELPAFASLAMELPLQIRFIEFMPFLNNQWSRSRLYSYNEMRTNIESHFDLIPVPREVPSQPAEEFMIPGAPGRIGIIASITRPFCAACSRLRLSATGQMQTCLFAPPTVGLRPLLRSKEPESDDRLKALIRNAVAEKPYGHNDPDEIVGQSPQAMTAIGG